MWPFKRGPQPVTQPEFAALFEAQLRKSGEARSIAFEAETFSLVLGKGELRIFLGNHFDEYRAAKPERRQPCLERAVRAASKPLEIPLKFADALPSLLPRVRERVFHELMALRLRLDPRGVPDIPHRPVGRDFSASVAFDGPDSVAAIMAPQLSGWTKTLDEALVPAIANLERRSGGLWEQPAAGLWSSPWHDDHDAARVLLVDLVRGLEVKGDPVAMIPNQNLLLIAGSADAAALEAMAQLAAKTLALPRPMSGAAMRLRDREWVTFEPGGDEPGAKALRELRLQTLARDSAEQGELLRAMLASRREDVFVAKLMLIQNKKTGATASLTSWAENVPSLLPESESIVFGQMKGGKPAGIRATVSWEAAQRVLGDAMKPEGLHPERWRVSGFPTEEQFRAMGA